MNKMLLKKAAIQSVALMVAVITSSYAFQQYQAVEIYASDITQVSTQNASEYVETIELKESGIELMPEQPAVSTGSAIMAATLDELKNQVSNDLMEKLSNHYLVIKKPKANDITFTLEDLYVKKSIIIKIAGSYSEEQGSSSILRVRGADAFIGEPVHTEVITQVMDEEKGSFKEIVTKDYGKDITHSISITTTVDDTTGIHHSEIMLELDSVYAYSVYEDTNYYFIDLRKPSDVYDKIIVIDPGHGGKDAGALSKNKQYYEKNINLGIALALKELLDKENIKVYYTRTTDDTVFLRPRVTLGNAVDCDYYISIHCNSNEVTSPNGTEVLYYDTKFKGVAAADLAKLFSEELGNTVGLRNRGTILKHMEDIFIMDKAEIPMVLIEMGYLSNSNDLNYLTDLQNQKTVAQGIYNAIMRAYEELPVTRR